MRYPYLLLNRNLKTSPIFPELNSAPLILDLSSEADFLDDIPLGDQKAFQHKLDGMLSGTYEWGLSAYLEYRETLLSRCPQMVREKRFYHLGLDVIIPAGFPLHSPLAGTVRDAGFEEGKGNYGGYILLEHSSSDFETFYILFGHLNPSSLAERGTMLEPGDVFGRTGEFDENGNWFYHTHIQILTREGREQNMQFKGYCCAEDLNRMSLLCPSPYPLFMAVQNA